MHILAVSRLLNSDTEAQWRPHGSCSLLTTVTHMATRIHVSAAVPGARKGKSTRYIETWSGRWGRVGGLDWEVKDATLNLRPRRFGGRGKEKAGRAFQEEREELE